MFIHLGTRKTLVSPATFNPDEAWMQQQTRNVMIWTDEHGIDLQYLLHDRDTKFAESFNTLFKASGARIVRSPTQSPIANCYAESWIGTLKRECLNHFFCFSLKHLDHIVQTYALYYNRFRPHQSLGNLPPDQENKPPPDLPNSQGIGPVHRHAILGGLLSHYERKAA